MAHLLDVERDQSEENVIRQKAHRKRLRWGCVPSELIANVEAVIQRCSPPPSTTTTLMQAAATAAPTAGAALADFPDLEQLSLEHRLATTTPRASGVSILRGSTNRQATARSGPTGTWQRNWPSKRVKANGSRLRAHSSGVNARDLGWMSSSGITTPGWRGGMATRAASSVWIDGRFIRSEVPYHRALKIWWRRQNERKTGR